MYQHRDTLLQKNIHFILVWLYIYIYIYIYIIKNKINKVNTLTMIKIFKKENTGQLQYKLFFKR